MGSNLMSYLNNLNKMSDQKTCCDKPGAIHAIECKERKRLVKEYAKEGGLSNLEKIQRAERMGYYATMKAKTGLAQIIHISDSQILIDHDGDLEIAEIIDADNPNSDFNNSVKITGYLYAGELAGNEPIPEGQKFKVRETEKVFVGASEYFDRVWDLDGHGIWRKNEIEPYFE